MDKFDGMERLIVIAVGMDAIINNVPGEAGAEVPEVRSRMYRAITRANMMVLVVNEQLRGGWLEFLGRVRFSGGEEFCAEDEVARCNDAAQEVTQQAEEEAAQAALAEAAQAEAAQVEATHPKHLQETGGAVGDAPVAAARVETAQAEAAVPEKVEEEGR